MIIKKNIIKKIFNILCITLVAILLFVSVYSANRYAQYQYIDKNVPIFTGVKQIVCSDTLKKNINVYGHIEINIDMHYTRLLVIQALKSCNKSIKNYKISAMDLDGYAISLTKSIYDDAISKISNTVDREKFTSYYLLESNNIYYLKNRDLDEKSVEFLRKIFLEVGLVLDNATKIDIDSFKIK